MKSNLWELSGQDDDRSSLERMLEKHPIKGAFVYRFNCDSVYSDISIISGKSMEYKAGG